MMFLNDIPNTDFLMVNSIPDNCKVFCITSNAEHDNNISLEEKLMNMKKGNIFNNKIIIIPRPIN